MLRKEYYVLFCEAKNCFVSKERQHCECWASPCVQELQRNIFFSSVGCYSQVFQGLLVALKTSNTFL